MNLRIDDVAKGPALWPPSNIKRTYEFPLDPFQQHAITAICADEDVLVTAKTGSGKTLVGEYQITHSLARGGRVFYTTPIKSLSNQKFHDLKKGFPDATVGILTGDIKSNPDAQIVVMTAEILRNKLYNVASGTAAEITLDGLDAVVMDEVHYINDRDRGHVWEETLILLPPTIRIVLLSATISAPEKFAGWLGNLRQHPIHLISTQYRIVPLTYTLIKSRIGVTGLTDIEFVPIYDTIKEKYEPKIYKEWLAWRETPQMRLMPDGSKKYKEPPARQPFTHQINVLTRHLETVKSLPAIFFVFSRARCEQYAAKLEGTYLTSTEQATIKHIFNFHMHRHRDTLGELKQYNVIYSYLERGIAYHHSGLLPLIKEIIEILFIKGYVKVLFCTETFAVGLNMPTKTVVFTDLRKYDDACEDMRLLRTDEFIQMAGRAGRRGIDTEGLVIYMPERDAETDLGSLFRGELPQLSSHLKFSEEFVLKSYLQESTSEKLIQSSFWRVEQTNTIATLQNDIAALNLKIAALGLKEKELEDCGKRVAIEQALKNATNAAKKPHQRELDGWKNRHMGPAWEKAWRQYSEYLKLRAEIEFAEEQIVGLSMNTDTYGEIDKVIDGLITKGFITDDGKQLTLKGRLATGVNEGDCIKLSEFYLRVAAENEWSTEDIVTVLGAFLGEKEGKPTVEVSVGDLSLKVKEYLTTGSAAQWACISRKWLEGVNVNELCGEYEIFEGNLLRGILKLNNIVNEFVAMATYCENVALLDQFRDITQRILKDIAVVDSLYLRL